ncbi:MAG: hypothetical protein L6437_03420, partial [Kiritimatiellae bacterium]|nr:hypothetical protein [Kiritimatiellia bacterium]
MIQKNTSARLDESVQQLNVLRRQRGGLKRTISGLVFSSGREVVDGHDNIEFLKLFPFEIIPPFNVINFKSLLDQFPHIVKTHPTISILTGTGKQNSRLAALFL